MNNVCSWPDKGSENKGHSTRCCVEKKKGMLELIIQRVLACSSNSIICYRLYEVVRSVESITVLLIRNGPIVWPVLSDYYTSLVLVEEERREKIKVTCVDFRGDVVCVDAPLES